MAPAGHFGPAVIGEEQHEKEQKQVHEEMALTFGPAVTGGSNMTDEAPDEPAVAEGGDEWPEGYTFERSGVYYAVYAPDGEMVESETESGKWHGKDDAIDAARAHAQAAETEAVEEADAAAEGEPQVDDMVDATIEEAVEALEANPELVDIVMRAEIVREDGTRPEVLEALEAAEATRDEPREEVLEALESLWAEHEDGDEE